MLKVNDINVYYGNIHAIKGVSFEVNEGEIVTLIGANGAGKSTILKTISGLLRSATGSIEFLGHNISNTPPHKIVSQSLAHVPEGRRIFLQMTVQEFGTIMEHRIPVKMILLNNNYLGNVRQWQQFFYDRRYSFTHLANPDFQTLASSYDIPSCRVIDRADLQDAVKEMLDTDGPFLLEACVAEEGNVMPMTPPGQSIDNMLMEC